VKKKTELVATAQPRSALQALFDDDGSFVVGYVQPIPCAAIASDEHNMLAALVRRPEETLTDLLHRLDAAVAKARDEDVLTDEINTKRQPRR
jgi:hypothetical protein